MGLLKIETSTQPYDIKFDLSLSSLLALAEAHWPVK